jgi:hypothetical protein
VLTTSICTLPETAGIGSKPGRPRLFRITAVARKEKATSKLKICLDAEIKLGHEIIRLKDVGELGKGGKFQKRNLNVVRDDIKNLSDYGISRDLSARSQALPKLKSGCRFLSSRFKVDSPP